MWASVSPWAQAKTLKHLEYFEEEKLIAAGRFIAEHGATEAGAYTRPLIAQLEP
jgi:hypothetical protein